MGMSPPVLADAGGHGFRSFGAPKPEPEPEPEIAALPLMLLPVKIVIDRDSLAQLGYEIAAVVAAAVHDGIQAGIDPDGDTLPPDEPFGAARPTT